MSDTPKSVKALIARAKILHGHLSQEELHKKASTLRQKMDESSAKARADLYSSKPSIIKKLLNTLVMKISGQ